MSVEGSGRADFVVVGGGVIGLSIAYELAKREREVLVLERDRPGAGATAVAGGMLAPVIEAELEQPELIVFGHDSLRRFPAFVEGLEEATGKTCHYRSEGTLCVALNQDHQAEQRHLQATLRNKGLEARDLGPDEIREKEPHVSGRVLSGLEIPDDHQVDPRALAEALQEGVTRLGGRISCGAHVEGIASEGGHVRRVSGRDGEGREFEVETDRVILAAGAWSEKDVRRPDGELGVRPVKGQLVRLRGPRLIRHVLRTPEIYMVPRADGELLIGASMEEMGFDLRPTAGAVMDLLRHAWETVPGIDDLELVEVSVGLRSAVDDHLPVIGPATTGGLYLAFGHFRNGVLLAPATAHYLAEWLVSGDAPPELEPFLPGRLAWDESAEGGGA